jgi:hypothetical protein
MEIEKLIDGFEKLCYRIMIEMILLPKTIWLLCKRSKNCFDLVVASYNKDTDDYEFPHLTSPIKMVIFYAAFNLWFLDFFKNEPEAKQGYLGMLLGMDITHQIVLIFLFSSFVPLITSLIIVKVQKSSIPGSVFKLALNAVFYSRIYYYIAIILFYLLLLSEYKREYLKKELVISEDELVVVQEWIANIFLALFFWAIYKNLRSYYHILRSMIPSKRILLTVFIILGLGEALFSLLQVLALILGE